MDINSLGFPTAFDNARKKDVVLYDTVSLDGTSTSYNLFKDKTLIPSRRNKLLPPTGQEIYVIKKLSLNFIGAIGGINVRTAGYSAFMNCSYVLITVNDVVKLKIPVNQLLNAPLVSYIGTGSYKLDGNVRYEREYSLEYPIILNSNCNVSIQLILDSSAVSTTAGHGFTLNMHTDKYDKLSDIPVDLVRRNQSEILSFVAYDTFDFVAADLTKSFFASNNKSTNYTSKAFPLADNEAMIVKAIELMQTVGNTGTGASTPLFYRNSFDASELTISINDVEYLTVPGSKFVSVLTSYDYTFNDTATPAVGTAFINSNLSKRVFLLETPLVIPSKSDVKVIWKQLAATTVTGNFYHSCLMLKGDLIRRVQ